jgi:hypothetical protein
LETEDKQREATATIRGYIYQFDASIRKILLAHKDDSIVVEGIEDFDIYSNEAETYGQVKYYESQKLTDSIIRKSVVPMLRHYLKNPPAERSTKSFIYTDISRIFLQAHSL